MDRRMVLGGGLSLLAAGTAQGQAAGIRVDRYGRSGAPGTIVLLHGSDGLTNRGRYEGAASLIAAASGYQVLLPRYFEATGDSRARYGDIRTKYPVWAEALAAALVEEAGSAPLALVGFSLGGALALSLGAQSPRVRAVVNFFGFLPEGLDQARRLPPTLILHGDADRVVPVSNAQAIERLLRSRGVPVESRIYPGEGHGLSRAAFPDALERAQAFITRYLAA